LVVRWLAPVSRKDLLACWASSAPTRLESVKAVSDQMLDGEAEMGQLIRERGPIRRIYRTPAPLRLVRCFRDALCRRDQRLHFGGVTKLDVLDTLDEIKVCVGYNLNGRNASRCPRCRRTCAGRAGIRDATGLEVFNPRHNRDERAAHQRSRLRDFLSEKIGVEIGLVSTGPNVRRRSLFRIQRRALAGKIVSGFKFQVRPAMLGARAPRPH